MEEKKEEEISTKKKHKWVKPTVISVLIFCAFLAPVVSVITEAYSSYHPYSQSYYAALVPMTKKLDETKEKKIVILGTSSVTFGVYSKLMEQELANAKLDYKVVNYGLYGSLGTKLMMELSKDSINSDDIVLFAPEFNSQTMSDYFSCKETYRAIDTEMNLVYRLDQDERMKMVENLYSFASEKYQYQIEKKELTGSGVYALSSFDENMDFTLAERSQNSMSDYYDPDNLIDFKNVPFTSDFVDYINEYYSVIRKKGAQMYYAFSPMDKLAVKDTSQEALDSYYSYLENHFNFPVLGSPVCSIYEPNYFFDSNFHLNTNGMIHHTLTLIEELKTEFLNTTPNLTPDPQMPDLPEQESKKDESLSNEDVDCFTYIEDGNNYEITGLTEEGLKKDTLTVPGEYEGKAIVSIANDTFEKATNLTSLTIQSNITRLRDKMFENCANLKSIHIQQKDPTKLAVGFYLLTGIEDHITLYIPKDSLASYLSNYSWSYYSKYFTEEA